MSPLELETYLHTHIPLSRAMEVHVLEASDAAVRLQAPLEPNLNHRSTVFGGSLTTLAILSAWSWLHRFTRSQGLSPALVIQREKMQFDTPASGPFRARCQSPAPELLQTFLHTLQRYQRARLELHALVTVGEKRVGRFHGSFVALNAPAPNFDPSPP